MKTPVLAKRSSIHGTGVFSCRNFKSGEIVVHWKNTKEITKEEFEKLPSEEKRFTDIQEGKILLVGTPERYVNHSCEANTKPGILCDIAMRDISEGEEITADYCNFFILDGRFQCECRSKSCRKTITGKS